MTIQQELCYKQKVNSKNTTPKQETLPPLEIPPSALSETAIEGLISEFILRDGTDYGLIEVSYETKVNSIQKQIENGHIVISFDQNTESVTLLTQQEWKKQQKLFS